MARLFQTKLVSLGLGIALAAAQSQTVLASDCDKSKFRIVIDVGHSPEVPGAISARGVTEYSYNLHLAGVIERQLISRGFGNVFRLLTGGGPENLALRSAHANALAPNLFLSIHHDSVQPKYLEQWTYGGHQGLYSDRFKGWSLFVSASNPNANASVRFATMLADRLLRRGLPFSTHHSEPIEGEGKRFVDASRGIYRYDGLAVLKAARAPAVLMESGVIVNRAEETALSTPARENAIAESMAEAVESYCGERNR
jgi:N-acetylmuramoyl-L-alanine amidase